MRAKRKKNVQELAACGSPAPEPSGGRPDGSALAGAQLEGQGNRFFFLESTFIDQNNPKRQTAGPRRGSPKLDLSGLV